MGACTTGISEGVTTGVSVGVAFWNGNVGIPEKEFGFTIMATKRTHKNPPISV
jgi:hypothetical protein